MSLAEMDSFLRSDAKPEEGKRKDDDFSELAALPKSYFPKIFTVAS